MDDHASGVKVDIQFYEQGTRSRNQMIIVIAPRWETFFVYKEYPSRESGVEANTRAKSDLYEFSKGNGSIDNICT